VSDLRIISSMVATTSVLVRNEEVEPLVRFAVVNEDIGASALGDLQPGRELLQSAHAGPTVAGDENPVAVSRAR
jgi:hypothetical protein